MNNNKINNENENKMKWKIVANIRETGDIDGLVKYSFLFKSIGIDNE